MQFRIISTVDRSITSINNLERLSQDLRPSVLCQVEDDGTLTHMGLITVWDLVFFARTWAGWVNPEPSPEALRALELVDRWLEDGESVAAEELERAEAVAEAAAWAAGAAYAAAYAAAGAAAWAAWAAAWAAAGAAKADAGAAAEAAARAAVEAAAANAAGADGADGADAEAARRAMFERQGQFILETLGGR